VTTDEILSMLEGVKTVAGGWMARCPAHSDETPSLKVTASPDGSTLLHCHALCPVENVVRALNLEMRDLFAEQNIPRRANQPWTITTYSYRDEHGQVTFCRERRERWIHGKRKKSFIARQPDGTRGGSPPHLYMLDKIVPAVTNRRWIIVCEGEKAADALERNGFSATTSGGAASWRSGYAAPLSGALVLIWPDNDEPGERYAGAVAADVVRIAAEVRVLRFPGKPTGWDAADYFVDGGTPEQLAQLIENAPRWSSASESIAPGDLSSPAADSTEKAAGLLFDFEAARYGRLLGLPAPERRWLVGDMLPLGITGAIAGRGGVGKSTLCLQLAVAVAAGVPFLDFAIDAPGTVLFLSAEDDRSVLLERVRQLVGHMLPQDPQEEVHQLLRERLVLLPRVGEDNRLTVQRSGGAVEWSAVFTRLQAEVERIADVRLIVLDPITRFRGGDANSEADATRFVEVLERLAQSAGATVLAVAHHRKTGKDEVSGQEQVRGSSAFVDSVRWVTNLSEQGRAGSTAPHARFLLSMVKSNYTTAGDGILLARCTDGPFVKADSAPPSRTDLQNISRLITVLGSDELNRTEIERLARTKLGLGQKAARGVVNLGLKLGMLRERRGAKGAKFISPVAGSAAARARPATSAA
jgi:hypothetical protein